MSPSNLDSSFCFINPAFLIMYSVYKLNKQGDNIQPWCTPFLIWKQSVVPCLVLAVASWSAYRFLRRQVRWSGNPISQNFPQFIVIYRVKSFGIINKAEVDVFWYSIAFYTIQQTLAIWSLVPLPFLNPSWTSGSSRFTYCWSLAWRILSITLLVCEMSTIMTNLDSILKSSDITLPTKIHLVKAMVFPVVVYGCESWTVKKAECWITDAFKLWC